MKYFQLLVLVFILMSCSARYPIGITKVVIRNNDFIVIKELDQKEIEYLESSFPSFVKIDRPPNTKWTHRIDITAEKLSDRWLYNKEGYISRLNYTLNPSFKITNPDEFAKRILALHDKQ